MEFPATTVGRRETVSPTVNRMVAGEFAEGPDYQTWRSHGTGDWLLIHTVSGRGRLGLPDASDRPAELITTAGDAVLLAPGTTHDYRTAPGSERGRDHWGLLFSHFRPRTDWLPLLDWPEVAPGIGRLRLDGEIRLRVEHALRRAVELSRSGLGRSELFGLNALETALLWAGTRQPGVGALDPRLVTVLELIANRLNEPLHIDRLAAAVGLSGSRLAHLFRTQIGVAPRQFWERQRMQAAEQLLELTDRSVAEVARAVGYADPLYFSTRFKRYAGSSPTDRRRAHRG